MDAAIIDTINKGIRNARSQPPHTQGGFRDSVMESVSASVPGIEERWERGEGAERKAIEAVRDGIRSACEISVALAPNKGEAERHISEAERQLLSGDRTAMGLHLASRLEAIDGAVSRHEKEGWTNTSPEAKQFIQAKFGELCGKLDRTARDPDLVNHCAETRKLLFPRVSESEYKRESARGQLRHTGTKGVAELMTSGTARGPEGRGGDARAAVIRLRSGSPVRGQASAERGEGRER